MERGCSPQAIESLWNSASDASKRVERRLRYLWSLHVLGGLTEERVGTLLQDKEAYVRAWTIQLELEDQKISDDLLKQLQELAASDPSPVVRLYLTSALQRLPNNQRWGDCFGFGDAR